MRFNRDVEYALMCLLQMGQDKHFYSARDLSDQFNIPYTLLCKVLQRLTHAEILASTYGNKGGYSLTRDLTTITIKDVVVAMRGDMDVVPCISEEESCSTRDTCNIKEGTLLIHKMWYQLTESLTLDAFARGGI